MSFKPTTSALIKLAPNVGHVILCYAAIDTMLVLIVELVRLRCEDDGVMLKRARTSTERVEVFKKAMNSPCLHSFRDAGLALVERLTPLKMVRDLLAHGQLDIHGLGESDTLRFLKVDPNRNRTAQEAQRVELNVSDLRTLAANGARLQADVLMFVVALDEFGGWAEARRPHQTL